VGALTTCVLYFFPFSKSFHFSQTLPPLQICRTEHNVNNTTHYLNIIHSTWWYVVQPAQLGSNGATWQKLFISSTEQDGSNRSVILQSSRPRKSVFQVSELQLTNCRCNQHSMLYVGNPHMQQISTCFFPESGTRSHTEAAGSVPFTTDNDVNILWTGWPTADQATLKWFNHLLNTFQPCTHGSSSRALEERAWVCHATVNSPL